MRVAQTTHDKLYCMLNFCFQLFLRRSKKNTHTHSSNEHNCLEKNTFVVMVNDTFYLTTMELCAFYTFRLLVFVIKLSAANVMSMKMCHTHAYVRYN